MKRSQLKRSIYRVLGKREEAHEEEEEEPGSHDSHLSSHDQEIYDEDDFYHQVHKFGQTFYSRKYGKKTSFLGNGTIMVSSEKYLCEIVCIGKYL